MKQSGILLHVASLPSSYGIGDLGPQAYAFVDFLKNGRQSFWQVLPINPTDGINAHSPYSCSSAFAGNPLLISPQCLVVAGYLAASDLKNPPLFPKSQIDYDHVKPYKEKLLKLAFTRWSKRSANDQEYSSFFERNAFWLDDYALFVAAKKVYDGKSWNQWPKPLKLREPSAVRHFSKQHRKQMDEVKFIQYVFFKQWQGLKDYAHSQGIKIIGDIPIYVNYDSAEVWCHPRYFKLTQDLDLKFVSGCPPDYFSKTGQRWGNPVYDWSVLKKNKYEWWQKRIEHNLTLFDFLRIDHFRGFESYWQIPAHERLAVFGRWVKAPGKDFFKTLRKSFQDLPIIAEDLGEITKEVNALMKHLGFPGMRVLLFGFGGDPKTNPHVPHNYSANCVAYTGTHDNNTIIGWITAEAKPNEIQNLKKILGVKNIDLKKVHWQMLDVLMASVASKVIIPLQDILGLAQEARMNMPSTTANNWRWRFRRQDLTESLALKLSKITRQHKRG